MSRSADPGHILQVPIEFFFRNILPPVDICPRQLSHQFEPAMSLKDLYLLATCRENWQLETQPLQFREELPTATSSDASAFMSLQQRERSSDSWTDIQVLLHEQQEAREKESTEEYFRSLSVSSRHLLLLLLSDAPDRTSFGPLTKCFPGIRGGDSCLPSRKLVLIYEHGSFAVLTLLPRIQFRQNR